MERDGHVREASSIKFDGINRLFRRARLIAKLLLVRNEVHRSGQRTSSNDSGMVRHAVILEYVYTIFICE